MKHFAEYFVPGIVVEEMVVRELRAREVVYALADWPEHAFAFRFFDLPEDVPESTELYEVRPKRQNVSARHYVNGQVFSLEEVEALGAPELATVLSNMRSNEWSHVVRTRLGNWQPFIDGAQVVEV